MPQVMDLTEKSRIDSQDKKEVGVLTGEEFCIVYAVCHVTGMLSACANPVIYGYLNENFNREFKEIFGGLRECVRRLLEPLERLFHVLFQGRQRPDPAADAPSLFDTRGRDKPEVNGGENIEMRDANDDPQMPANEALHQADQEQNRTG